MPFIPSDKLARQQGEKNPLPNYKNDTTSTFQGALQGQIRIGGTDKSVEQVQFAAKSNLMGDNDGQGVQLNSAHKAAKAAPGVTITDAAPMKRTVVSKTTAAAQHLAAKRWGVK